MAAKDAINAKRRFSLNILSASKTTEDRPKIWTTQNDIPEISSDNASNGKLTFNNTSVTPPQKKTTKPKSKKRRRPPVTQISEIQLTSSERYLSWRYLMAFLLQTSMVVAIFLRNCMPMALVCMVKPRNQSSISNISGDWFSDSVTSSGVSIKSGGEDGDGLTSRYGNDRITEDKSYEFDWDSDVQGLILTSTLFTTFLGPLLASFIRERLGSKLTLTLFNLSSCVLTVLAPAAARLNPYLLVALRMLLGITLGANIPVIGDSIAWWSPQAEKLTITALTFTGVNIGGILASLISGFLCSIPVDNGWPFIFYIFGAMSLLWGVAWHFLSSQKPEDHPYISEKERDYIVSHRVGMEPSSGGKKEKPPYLKILTSVPVLSFIATVSCHIWSTNLIFTYLPVYFTDILGFSIQMTGLLVSLISTCRMLGTFIWTTIGNKLMSFFSTNRVRKICICSGFSVAALTQVGVAFFDRDNKWVAFGLLITVMIFQAVGSCTLTVVPLDMAPRYGGFLTGLFVSIGSCVSISGPLVTAAITTNGTYEEWRTVWLIMAGVFFTGALLFGFFAEAKLQPWAQVNQPNLAHIVSPFITMGRRFSAFMDAPPLSPASPIKNKQFDFSIAIQASASAVAPGLATPTPQINNMEPLNFEKEIANGAEDNFPDSETESGDEEGVEDEIYENEGDQGFTNRAFEENESYIPARKRAYSEFGLQVIKPQVKEEEDETKKSEDKPSSFLGSDLRNQSKDKEVGQLRLSLQANTMNPESLSISPEEQLAKTSECTRL